MAQDVIGPIEAQDVAGQGPAPRDRLIDRYRILIAGLTLVAWMLLTTSNPFNVHSSSGLIGALTDGPQWGILLAALFVTGLAAVCRWGDLGLRLPISARSLLLLWLPAIYVLVFVALDVVAGPPPVSMVAFLALNIAVGAFSEEMMFRGVVLGALRTRLRPVTAIAISCALFGLAHLVNAAVFGSLPLAAAQAVAAAMSGVVFTALRLRTGSLIPAIIYHALWDFCSLMAVARILSSSGTAATGGSAANISIDGPSLPMLIAPILLLLPNFLYALFLLRRVCNSGTTSDSGQ